MDWDKIKRLFIMLLVVLNAGLFGAIYLQGSHYHMTSEEEAAIFRVLSENHVGIYTDLIYDTPPMRAISVSPATLDPQTLQQAFFDPEEEVRITLQFDQTILASNEKSLILQGNEIQYLNPGGTGKVENFSRQTALETAEAFLLKMDLQGRSEMEVDKVEQNGDRFVVECSERYRNYRLFDSTRTITVSEQGVIMATARYYQVAGFSGEARGICSCDEALLTFLQQRSEQEDTQNIYIEKIELGYRLQSMERMEDGSTFYLVPCYRILTATNGEVCYIDAYTNEIIGE